MTREEMVSAFLEARPALEKQALRMLSCREDAEDVLQNVFLRAWMYCGSLRASSSFPGWIRQITAREAANLLRQRDETFPLEEAFPAAYASEDHAAEQIDFTHAMCTMSKPLRTTFCLRYLYGCSVQEIASRLNCPLGTVGRRLYDARRWMRRQLRDS